MSKPLPGLSQAAPTSQRQDATETYVSTLENGLRVASQSAPGAFCTLGVVIDSGSRYETKHPSGISHFLDKLAFGATEKFEGRDEIMEKMAKVAGIVDASTSRDTLIYVGMASQAGAEQTLELMSEVTLKPRITELELEVARRTIEFELDTLNNSPEPDMQMLDLYHSAAYRDNTLGLPKLCPAENINTITRNDILSYMAAYHRPERMVVTGVGIEHAKLEDLARKYFVNTTPTWAQESGVPIVEPDQSLAQYTGGMKTVERDMSVFATGPSPMPDLVHAVIGLESCSHKEEDFIAFCVLQSLMGGGGSFSAGGPGKGMYTRLYTNVLNNCGYMWSATAQNHAYNDGGTFAFHVSAVPQYIRDMFKVVTREIVSLKQGVGPVELERAKKQLQSLLFMNLEFRPVQFEDIGRQVLANGRRETAKYYKQKIDEISSEDVVRVSNRLLDSRASVAVLGSLKDYPTLEEVEAALRGQTSFKDKYRYKMF